MAGPVHAPVCLSAFPPFLYFLILISVLFFSFSFSGLAVFAGPAWGMDPRNPGSGNLGLTLMGGYNASYLDYTEEQNGSTLDRDYGYLNSAHIQARLENKTVWTRLTADYYWTYNASYDGAIQNLEGQLTAYKASTHEKIYQYEGDFGIKAMNASTSTLTPYLGIGYRIWWRGADALPDYIEKYTWYFAAAGFNYIWRINRLTAGLDTALHIPFDMQMKTNVAGLFDQMDFTLKKRVGFGVQLPFTYDIYNNHAKPVRIFVYLTPYYQFWPVGGSGSIAMTKNGIPVFDKNGNPVLAHEPDSRTGIYGGDAGLGVNF